HARKRLRTGAGLDLLAGSDGTRLTINQLADQQQRFKAVRVSAEEGSMLDAAKRVWQPRAGEQVLVARTFRLEDATEELRRAQVVRARPKVASLAAPLGSPWRAA